MSKSSAGTPPTTGVFPETVTCRKLRILCLHGFRQNASSFKGRTASLAKKLKDIAEFVFIDAPHELSFLYHPCTGSLPSQETLPPEENCRKKFAWLVSPEHGQVESSDWKEVKSPFCPLQYQQQTCGLEVSIAHVKSTLSQKGPFDGILGFSQGAAVAAAMCSQSEGYNGKFMFRFVILCSGFAATAENLARNSLKCPSLHIFARALGRDRQIGIDKSKDLALLFDDEDSVMIEHDLGHMIPTRPPYIDQIRSFLLRFV